MATTLVNSTVTTVRTVGPATVAAATAQLAADALALLANGTTKTATAAIVAHGAGITGRSDKQLRAWLRDLLRTADCYAQVAAHNAKHLHAAPRAVARKAAKAAAATAAPAAPAAPAAVAPPAAPAPDYRNLPLAALRKLAAQQGVGKTLAGKRCASSGKQPIIEALLAHHAAA
jgi:hypothetical protein